MRDHCSFPPDSGPGSSKAEWRQFAFEIVDLVVKLRNVVEQRENEIAYLKGETELLRKQVAERKPKGAREAIPPETVRRIEACIERGDSTRYIAKQFDVSAMTASRIKKRMAARNAASVT